MHPVIRAAVDDAAEMFGPDKVTFTESPDGSVKVTILGQDIGDGWQPRIVSITATLLATFPSPPPYPFYLPAGLAAYELARQRTSDRSAAAGAKMLGELLDNATTHAGSPVGVYAAAQVHQRSGNLELAVADGGIGVRAHLARNPSYRNLTAAQALRAALRPGVTGTSEKRGNGLPDLLGTACSFGGQLLLRSDDGYAQVMATSQGGQFAGAGQVPGTWAWVHVRLTHSPHRMLSLQQ